ncbi:MAG: STAS domain-containing protein [Candidatus Omnitrophica bacterium]|nr:STAS domain-containing protein [Candidatus Omnitrophota bacterium]
MTERLLDQMRQILTVAFLSRKYKLVFDFESCEMIDSYFIGLLISTHRELKELGGELKCVGVHGQIAHAFEIIRFDKIISIYDTIETAVDSSDFFRAAIST